MDIQDPLRKLLYKPRREQSHVACQANQLHAILFKCGHDLTIVLLSQLAPGGYDERIQPTLARRLDPRRVRLVRDDNCDPRIRNSPGFNAVCNREEIGSAPGK